MSNIPANEDHESAGKALPPTEYPGSSDEGQTLDSSIQSSPAGVGSSVPESQASTILPLEENIETMEGVTALPGKSPERIASFRLLGVIGTGGMGKVYLAVQDRPRRHVAVKVMKAGVAGEQAMRRFEFEAELLARLVHAGIAQIYEAGTWDEGDGAAPYFAMEYVPSARILTDFCRERELSTRGRVELFIKACEAVGYGHQKGIIHRDLKPGNMLVGSRGNVKIIDFGVARSTDSDKSVTMQTDIHAIVGTLQYMAPEQCGGDVLDLDTSADVYALGVTLYDLLTGELPYDISGESLVTAIQIVGKAVPKRLDTFDRSLSGDLDIIVQKALAKDRVDRYRTASELGDDLNRWLSDEPITASPPTIVTTLRRAVRRNKGLVAAAISLVALLVLSVLVGLFALVQKNDALDARATALQVQNDLLEEQARKREMVGGLINFFMEDSFREISKLANSQEARESLVSVSLEYLERLRAEAGEDPSVQRMLADGLVLAGRNRWSLTSGNRGDLDGAMENYIEGVALADELYAAGDEQARNTALQGRLLLLQGYRRLGDTDSMHRMVSESEAMVVAVDDPLSTLEFARLVFELRLQGMRLRPKGSDLNSEPSVQALVDVAEELGKRHVNSAVARDTTLAWNALGQAWSENGDHAKALSFYERSVEARREIAASPDSTNTAQRDLLNAYRYAATQRGQLGKMDEVISDYQLHIVPLARVLVADNPSDSRTREDLALALMEYGSYLAYSQDQQRRAGAVAPLSEARIVWSEYLKNRDDDVTRDLTTTRRLLQCEAALALAYLAADATPSARGAVDRGETIIASARKSWPDDRRLQSRINELLRVRAMVLEEQGRLDRP
jgi:serine/threonine protein kinase/tetratricopeptide (TPR) repeat protein